MFPLSTLSYGRTAQCLDWEEGVFDVITFDCYGTLIDWEAGMVEAFWRAATANGVSLDRPGMLRALFDTPPASAAPEHQPYRERLTVAAMRVGERLGWPITRERAALLPNSLAHWAPFPDANPALERLHQAGYALGILSNVDDDLLAGTLRHRSVGFSVLVTATSRRQRTSRPRGTGLAPSGGSTRL